MSERSMVLWSGPLEASVGDALVARDLEVVSLSAAPSKDQLAGAFALVVALDTARLSKFRDAIHDLGPQAERWGVAVYAYCPLQAVDQVRYILATAPCAPPVIASMSVDVAANTIASSLRTPTPNFALHLSADVSFSDEEELLLRRAFASYEEIELTPLKDGASGARVWQVQARRAARRTLPYFAKIGPSDSIDREWERYEELVRNHVPFYVRPNLESPYLRGHKLSILVGSFVEGSISFLTAAQRFLVSAPTQHLFDETLRGWRLLQERRHGAFSSLDEYHKVGRISAGVEAIAHQRGCKRTKQQLTQSLSDLPFSAAVGPIHGDLHARNVHVRGNDAVLLDFERVQHKMPQALDPAWLEIDLVFTLYGKDPCNGWETLIRELYGKCDHLLVRRPPRQFASDVDWLWNTVRLIRLHALCEMRDHSEYAAALAINMVRFAGGDAGNGTDPIMSEQRRVDAYCHADELLTGLEGTHA